MRGLFWQKDSFITHTLFELQPIIIFSPVANFGDQSLVVYYTDIDQKLAENKRHERADSKQNLGMYISRRVISHIYRCDQGSLMMSSGPSTV